MTVAPRPLSDRQRHSLHGLVETHETRIRGFLSLFVWDMDVIDDLTQETFIGVVPRCEDVVSWSEDEAAAYLRGIARNAVRRWRRTAVREERKRKNSIRWLAFQSTEERLERESEQGQDQLEALRACLKRLSRQSFDLVREHFFQRVPETELARRMNKSGAAVRMLFYRIRRKLSLCVQDRLGLKEDSR